MTVTYVSAGSSLSSYTVKSGDELDVLNGGSVTGVVVQSGGTLVVMSGGTDSNGTVQAGGSATIYGKASGDQLAGTVSVGSQGTGGGFLTDANVTGGGTVLVGAGGLVSYTIFRDNSVLELQAPTAAIQDSISFTLSAKMQVDARPAHANQIQTSELQAQIYTNPKNGNVIDLPFLPFTSAVSSSVTRNPYNDNYYFTVMSGGVVEATITIPDGHELAPSYEIHLRADTAGNTELYVVPCFCPGTAIATADGERPVEALAIGDTVLTAAGALRPIRWIGHRSYAGRFLRANPAVQPVRVLAGALGGGLPRRDLRVSPLHALLLDGVLVPAGLLVNGTTILREQVDQVRYLHIELDQHDVLLAEGAPAESFVDDNGRAMFHNAAEWAALYRDPPPAPATYCARRVEGGFELAAIRNRLARLAAA